MKDKKWLKYVGYFILTMIILNIISKMISPESTVKSNAQIQNEKENSIAKAKEEELYKMYRISRKALKENLRDPDSYDEVEYTSNFTKQSKKEKTYIQVKIKYRAKNGFGGMTVKERYFNYDKNMALIETFEE
jgi:Na+-translocating ferredoxin:NAD+ oxidoreductase RnfG subunit